MAFDLAKDIARDRPERASAPGRDAFPIASAAGELPVYAKALRIYVPSALSEASIVVYCVKDGAAAVARTLKYPPGRHIEPLEVWKVGTITGAGVEVHGYAD